MIDRMDTKRRMDEDRKMGKCISSSMAWARNMENDNIFVASLLLLLAEGTSGAGKKGKAILFSLSLYTNMSVIDLTLLVHVFVALVCVLYL